jgi:hypothetical protein
MPRGKAKAKENTTSASPVPATGESSSENEDATGGQAGAANLSSHPGSAQAPPVQRTNDNGGSNVPRASGEPAASAERQPVQPLVMADRHVSFALQQSAGNEANASADSTISTLRLDPRGPETARPSEALNSIAEQIRNAQTQAFLEQQRMMIEQHMVQQINEAQASHLTQQQIAQQHLQRFQAAQAAAQTAQDAHVQRSTPPPSSAAQSQRPLRLLRALRNLA